MHGHFISEFGGRVRDERPADRECCPNKKQRKTLFLNTAFTHYRLHHCIVIIFFEVKDSDGDDGFGNRVVLSGGVAGDKVTLPDLDVFHLRLS